MDVKFPIHIHDIRIHIRKFFVDIQLYMDPYPYKRLSCVHFSTEFPHSTARASIPPKRPGRGHPLLKLLQKW